MRLHNTHTAEIWPVWVSECDCSTVDFLLVPHASCRGQAGRNVVVTVTGVRGERGREGEGRKLGKEGGREEERRREKTGEK